MRYNTNPKKNFGWNLRPEGQPVISDPHKPQFPFFRGVAPLPKTSHRGLKNKKGIFKGIKYTGYHAMALCSKPCKVPTFEEFVAGVAKNEHDQFHYRDEFGRAHLIVTDRYADAESAYTQACKFFARRREQYAEMRGEWS